MAATRQVQRAVRRVENSSRTKNQEMLESVDAVTKQRRADCVRGLVAKNLMRYLRLKF